MIKPWPKVAEKPLGNFRVFGVRSVEKRSPLTGENHEFFVIDSVNWVNVVAVTTDRQVVLVEQYRQASDTVELEIPGGMIDPTDGSPEAAGGRELLEETGYQGDPPRIIGTVYPNPAIMSNQCFTVLVENCRQTGQTHFDQTEDLITRLAPIEEIPALVSSGKIRHCIVISSLYHYELWRKRAG